MKGSAMRILQPSIDLESFFDGLREAPARILFLDYDGTLAPFVIEREKAIPYEGVRDRIRAIGEGGKTRIVIVSGRTTGDLMPLLDLDESPEIWGGHGSERRRPGGATETRVLTVAEEMVLAKAEEWGAAHNAEERLERKPASVALHVRGLPTEKASAVIERAQTVWEEIAGETKVEIHTFDGGIEMRVPGRDKGYAVCTVLAEAPDRTAAAYLGDDRTDEDAFRALAGRGLRVLVRPDCREPTEADLWIRPPEELLSFLDRWAASDGSRRSKGEAQ